MDIFTTPCTTAPPFGPSGDSGTRRSPAADPLFAGPGEMRARGRAVDWAATPLSPVEVWSPTLCAVVRTALASPFQIAVWCGPALTLVYHDAYVRAPLEAWRVDSNEHRPHSSLGHLTPREYARRRHPNPDAEAA